MLCLAVLTTGAANMLLSLTGSLLMFYLLFCVARMNFAGPFDLGIYGAVNNWFVRAARLRHRRSPRWRRWRAWSACR